MRSVFQRHEDVLGFCQLFPCSYWYPCSCHGVGSVRVGIGRSLPPDRAFGSGSGDLLPARAFGSGREISPTGPSVRVGIGRFLLPDRAFGSGSGDFSYRPERSGRDREISYRPERSGRDSGDPSYRTEHAGRDREISPTGPSVRVGIGRSLLPDRAFGSGFGRSLLPVV